MKQIKSQRRIKAPTEKKFICLVSTKYQEKTKKIKFTNTKRKTEQILSKISFMEQTNTRNNKN